MSTIIKRTKLKPDMAAFLRDATEPPPSRAGKQVNFTGTDDWAGERLAEHLAGKAYWLDGENQWIWWDGRVWKSGAASLLIKETTISAKRLALEGIEGDSREVLAIVKRRLSAAGVEAALKMARPHLRGDDVVWNPDRHLLNCPNGIVDLRTGDLLPHDPLRHMTLMAGAPYDPGRSIENFSGVLRRFQKDPAVLAYLHRQIGYRATGEVGERAFFCHLGEGNNGKSTVENMVARALGEYHVSASGGLFLQAMHAVFAKDANAHSEALYRLRFKRNVLLVEPDHKHRLDESLIKSFTDGQGSTYASRTLHRESVVTPVTQKIIFYSNNPPLMSAARSITNRLHALHWKETIDRSEENPNFPELFLVPELPGILAWIVQGAMAFYANDAKLGRPDFLTEGEEEYRRGSDPLGDFIDQSLLRQGLGVPFSVFYDRYKDFCAKKALKPTGANAIGRAMERHGLTVDLLNKNARHPARDEILAKELRWVPGCEWVS